MKAAACAVFAAFVLAACNEEAAAPVDPAPAASMPETPPVTEPPAVQLPPEDACNTAQYAGLIGGPADAAGVPVASPQVRHIRPDTQVTMDYSPTRLNIDISAEGVITGFRCG